jgi:galactokinase
MPDTSLPSPPRPAGPPGASPYPVAASQFADVTARPPEALEADAARLLAAGLEAEGATASSSGAAPSGDTAPASAVATAFARGSAGLLSDQTHYADGFALVAPLRTGLAVAVRRRPVRAPRSRLATRTGAVWSLDVPPASNASASNASASNASAGNASANDTSSGDASGSGVPEAEDARPTWVRLAASLVADLEPAPVDIALASDVPPTLTDGALAALAVALWRALRTLRGAESTAPALRADLPMVCAHVARALGRPFGLAPLFAAADGRPQSVTLVDTATHEFLPVAWPPPDALAVALLDLGAAFDDAAFEARRREEATEALRLLRARGFEHLRSFRELEHQHLHRALDALPARLRPATRHLVTENRRVQRMVAALRREDFQMVGALLLMTHASRRDAFEATTPEADALVAEAEVMTFDGVYGAGQTARTGHVVVAAQPRALPAALDRLAAAFAQRTGRDLKAMALN